MINNIPRRLTSYKESVYDGSYNTEQLAYNSVTDFVNDIADIEIAIAIKDFPNDYKEDDIYNKFKKFKDSQRITRKELDELLEMYDYYI